MYRKKRFRLRIIFIQSLLATLGSLYYGWFGDPIANMYTGQLFLTENGFSPCQLCRYARILIYPITLLSGLALIKNKFTAVLYIKRLSGLAIILETYHYILQKAPIQTSTFCTRTNPCNALAVDYLGFITIPLLALTAAIVIFIASYKISTYKKNETNTQKAI